MNLGQIIFACKQGRLSAQKALYTEYKSKLFGICMRYTKDISSAESMLKDSFLMICREIRAYKDSEPFNAWMDGMVIGHIVKRQKEFISDTQSNITKESAYFELVVDHLDKICKKTILHLIQDLPKANRLVFNLYGLDGLNHQEISEVLSISVQSSKTYYQTALEILYTKLQDAHGK